MMWIKNIGILIVSILFCFHGATAQSQTQTGESNLSERIVPILFYLLDESAGSINPVVSFDTPAEGQVFAQGDSVAVTASASDSDGTIAKVDLYLNDVIVNSDVQAPYQWSGGVLDTLAPGEHVLRLVAVDNLGNETAVERMIEVASDWISCATEGGVCSVPGLATVRYGANGQYNILTDIEVSVQCTNAVFGDPIPDVRKSCEYRLQESDVNQAPSVSFTAPNPNQSFTSGNGISVTANANDGDGTISRVDLYIDGVFEASDTSTPFSWTLNGLQLGSRVLQLLAVDDDGAESSVNITINIVENNSSNVVKAVINPSRTECASPCTVVFSAEKTTAQGLDDHGIWSQLSYHWDFDTDESDTHGALYDQTYTFVDGDTAYESGHVPMATKTFLCDSGTCTYNVGMRAQNAAGEFDDVFQTITVHAESTQWSAANTICVSNTLNLAADWTLFDKGCPAGATKQATLPLPDQFDSKLVLLRRGDVFDGDDLLDRNDASRLNYFAIQSGQSNYKVSNFGDNTDSFPDIQGRVLAGVASYTSSGATVTSVDTLLNDSDVTANGWTSNAYFEGLRLASFIFPESFSHVGIHDIDLDQEGENLGGSLSFSAGVRCTDHPTFLDCANVPFPKGGYISKTSIVGSNDRGGRDGAFLNIGTTGCVMVNFTGIVDTQTRLVTEHNLRIQGMYRFNIMRSAFLGGHYTAGRAKITPRSCISNSLFSEQWVGRNDLPENWQGDVEGRTRADIFTGTDDLYLHVSRYLVIAHNQIGSSNQAHWGTNPGSGKVGSGIKLEQDGVLIQDAMVSHNNFESEIDGDTILTVPDGNNAGNGPVPQDITGFGWYHTCVDNDYFDHVIRCYPTTPYSSWNVRREPTPITPPLKPGS